MQLLRSKDFMAGLVFIAIGAVTLIVGRSYRIGSASEMGSGYFPLLLGVAILALGVIMALMAWREEAPELIEPIHWRVVVFPTIGIILFALLLEPFGLVVALIALLGVGMMASAETRLKEMPFVIAGAIVFCIAVFIYGVELPMKVWPL